MGDNHFIKLFRLTQYSIEYLLYTQNYLESLCKAIDLEYKQNYENAHKMEETLKKYEDMEMDWPREVIDEERVTVWSDSSFASQEKQKSQGALVVTQSPSPIFWKCGSQGLIALSTAESELQMLCEGSLAAQRKRSQRSL